MLENLPPWPTVALVRREMLVLSRSGRLFGLLAAMTALLALAAVFILITSSATNASMAQFARRLFRTQFFFLWMAALVAVPGMAATGMITERKHDCFPLLYTTLIPPGWIVWSKVLAVVGMFAMLFTGCLPFNGLVYFFAGVEVATFFQGALVLFSLALGTASIGMYASSKAPDHGRALYHTGAAIVAMLLLPSVAVLAGRIAGVPSAFLEWVNTMQFGNAYGVVSSGIPNWRPPLAFAASQCVIAAAALFLARRRILPDRTGWKEHLRNRLPAIRGQRRPAKQRAPIADRQSPIAAKDIWANPLANGYRRYVLGFFGLVTGFVLTLPMYATGAMGMRGPGGDFVNIERYIFFIILPPMVAAMLAAEREHDTFDSLRMTLLDGTDFIRGKLWGAWRVIMPFVSGIIGGKVLFFVVSRVTRQLGSGHLAVVDVLVTVAAMLITVHAVFSFSLYSVRSRGSAPATVILSYVSVLANWVVCSIVYYVLIGLPFAILAAGPGYGAPIFEILAPILFYVPLFLMALLNRHWASQWVQLELKATQSG